MYWMRFLYRYRYLSLRSPSKVPETSSRSRLSLRSRERSECRWDSTPGSMSLILLKRRSLREYKIRYNIITIPYLRILEVSIAQLWNWIRNCFHRNCVWTDGLEKTRQRLKVQSLQVGQNHITTTYLLIYVQVFSTSFWYTSNFQINWYWLLLLSRVLLDSRFALLIGRRHPLLICERMV